VRGDKLVIKDEHVRAGRRLAMALLPVIARTEGRFICTIAGESGSGKSELASVLADTLAERRIESIILQQDDYFVYPPKTNAAMRVKDINHVGTTEVRLDLLDRNLADILVGKDAIEKPLVIYEEDRVVAETLRVGRNLVVIVEGTYTTLLAHSHRRIFIDRTNRDTRQARLERAREDQDEYLEQILEIEHRIISAHKTRADIVVTRDYDVEEIDEN